MNREEKILRELAYEYSVAALDERNAEKRRLHRAVNDLKQIRPVVLLDEIPFHELDYDGLLTLQCENPVLCAAEDYLRKQLFKWKHFPADMFLPHYLPVQKIIQTTGIGITVKDNILVTDAANNIMSHEYIDQIATPEDLEKLHAPVLTYERDATMEQFTTLACAIGDVLPVRITGHSCYMPPWDLITRYRGVTNVYYDLADKPEFMHAIRAKFAEFAMAESEQMEKLGLYEISPVEIHCTPAIASDLQAGYDGGNVMRRQIWGRTMAQAFGSVSKAMHEEFDINYQKTVMEHFGLVYYGCCEPLDKKIDILEKLPHLRKISISPWADVDAAAEAIGSKYVLSAKPNPAAVSSKLDEDALRAEISRILSACKRHSCNCDIVLKDISSAGYDLNNLVRWEQIVMEMVEQA